jgi:hypothetical protein
LKTEAAAVRTAVSAFFAGSPPRFIFVSPLADGADQMGAELALELGYELHAVLPFSRERTRADLSDDESRTNFDALLARATCVLELGGDEAHELDAYVMAGLATVAHCDMLIAVWDGLPPRGRGGTGEVVRFAFERATPVVHVPIPDGADPVLRWSAFDPAIVTGHDDPANVRPFDSEHLRSTLACLLAPPSDEQERHFMRLFQRECRRRLRTRIEYPLLLAATGVSAIRPHHWRPAVASLRTHAEWEEFDTACRRAECVTTPIATLEQWYEWADSLASHYAQSYRSGHVFNFALGALAVFLGTANLILPDWAIYLEVSLFLVVLAILANIWAANRLQWHRRWLDYRQLAERLRPMRSLKLLAVAAPDPPGTPANPVLQRWVEWYAAALWRGIGRPSGRIDARGLVAVTECITDHEIRPQVAYHHKAARQVGRLDHRLGVVGYFTFSLALLSSTVLITAFAVAPDWVHENYSWFTVISACLPAIGTAIVGIRVQGDHSASAARSEQTSVVLEQIGRRLRGETSLSRAADLAEQAARAMLNDLDEWRLLNQQHELSIS